MLTGSVAIGKIISNAYPSFSLDIDLQLTVRAGELRWPRRRLNALVLNLLNGRAAPIDPPGVWSARANRTHYTDGAIMSCDLEPICWQDAPSRAWSAQQGELLGGRAVVTVRQLEGKINRGARP
jgi:hypothetical protein